MIPDKTSRHSVDWPAVSADIAIVSVLIFAAVMAICAVRGLLFVG
jgi:hypothetical protein